MIPILKKRPIISTSHSIKYILIFFLFFTFYIIGHTQNIPQIINGTINLKDWNPIRDGIVELSGQWKFYWSEHIQPETIKSGGENLAFSFLQVPGSWNGHLVNGKKIPGMGYATYRLKVLLNDKEKQLSLKILDMATSYTIFINGKIVDMAGLPGKSPDKTTPFYHPKVVEFTNQVGQLDIVIHVSNFDHWQGGMWESILLGTPDQIIGIREHKFMLTFFLLGSILIIAVYHFFLFGFRPQNKSTLFFGIFCLLIAIRIFFTGERYIIYFFPEMSFQLLLKTVYISFYLCIPLFAMYMRLIFPHEVSGKVVKLLQCAGLCFSVFVLFTPSHVYSYTMPVYQGLTLLIIIYGIWAICRAIRNKRKGSLIFAIGLIVLFLCVGNDILYTRQIINTWHSVAVGLLFFIFSQAILIAKKFSMASALVETQRKELQLKNLVFDSAITANSASNAEGRITNINNTFFKLWGYERKEEVLGEPLSQFFKSEPKANAIITSLDETGIWEGEFTALKKDGSTFAAYGLATTIKSLSEGITGYQSSVIDISDRKKTENEKIEAQKIAGEQKKLALVGQVAGKMAHDFNNILGVIMGNTELSLMDCKEEETKRTLELIFEQTIRGKNLTKNLVAFAKDQEPKQEFFRISEKIDLVITLMKKDLDGIELIKEDKSGIPDLLADPGMIEHALVNLIQNSIHATSMSEHPQIKIKTYHLNDKICFEIEDNGCGISKKNLENIYEPSFTLKGTKDITGSYKTGIKGTGYGMANVKKYIEQHKGNLAVSSEFGLGTKITIGLPVIKKELTSDEKTRIQNKITHFEKYILLVEDEIAISDVQYKILTQAPCNHKVDTANNGQAAMDLFDKNEYDFVSLDYVLPGGITGMDVYHFIREINKAIPILFISGNIEFLESIKDLKQQDQYIDHLSKPCMNIDYLNCIDKLFEKLTS